MPAGKLDFTRETGHPFEAGSRFDYTFEFRDAADSVIDLTGYDPAQPGQSAYIGARVMLRKSKDDTDSPIISLTKTTTGGNEGCQILSGGRIRIVCRANLIAAQSFDTAGAGAPLTDNRSGVISIEVGGADETDVLRLTDGTFEIVPEVAR